MKICIVTPTFPPEIGGPATYTHNLAKLLHARGHKVRIVTFSTRTRPKKLKGVPIFSVKTEPGTFFRQRKMFFTILKVAKGSDLIYAQDAVVVGLVSVWAAKLLRMPIIVKFVGDIAWEKAFMEGKTSKFLDDFLKSPEGGLHVKMLTKVQRFVLRSANRVIVPSEYLKRLLVKHYRVSQDKIRVIHNAVDLEAYKKIKPKRERGPTVIFIGRLVPWKGLEGVIKVMVLLVKKYPRIKLLVVGEGPEKEKLKRLAKQLRVEKHVQFLGRIEHGRTMELLKDSDVLVLNSKYEGLPHVVIEAMACKVPVVATNIDGIREVIENGKTGILVRVGANKELQQGIERLLKDRHFRARTITNAYENVLTKFTWSTMIMKLEQVLSKGSS